MLLACNTVPKMPVKNVTDSFTVMDEVMFSWILLSELTAARQNPNGRNVFKYRYLQTLVEQ